jgi:hypothetical protein
MRLAFSETGRGELKSEEWYGRQLRRKVIGVLKAMDELVQKSGGQFLVRGDCSIADIAVGLYAGHDEHGGDAFRVGQVAGAVSQAKGVLGDARGEG